jgi:hypothetical protein
MIILKKINLIYTIFYDQISGINSDSLNEYFQNK